MFLLKGIAQWAVLSAVSLSVLALVVSFADACSTGIISASFNVNNWQGLSGDKTFMAESVKGLSGIALGALSFLLVIPFALGLLTEVLIREAGMEVLAATFPIVVAGLVHEKFARWYWTALRWMLALIFMLPLIALSMAIGHSIGLAAGHVTGNTGAQLGQSLVSGLVSLLTLVWPLALFKLFSFVDPNTVAGTGFRAGLSGLSGSGSGISGGDTEGAEQESEGSSDSGAGGLDPTGGGKPGQEKSGGGDQAGSTDAMSMLQAGAEALRSFGGDQAAGANDRAAGSFDGVGAGHPGGGGAGGSQEEEQNEDGKGQQDPTSSKDSNDQGGGSGDGGDEPPIDPIEANTQAVDDVSGNMPGADQGGSSGGGGQLGPGGGEGGPGGGTESAGAEGVGAEEAAVMVV